MDRNYFNKIQEYNLFPNQLKSNSFSPADHPKLLPNLNSISENKDHISLLNHDLGVLDDETNLIDRNKESPNKFGSSNSANIVYPEYSKTMNYYHEFWLMYLQNEIIIAKMKEYVGEIKSIQKKIDQYELFIANIDTNGLLLNSSTQKNSKKKKRRTAAEIQKEFECPYSGCQKTYGSDVSLNLHIKLKHGGGNKTEREKLAKKYVLSKLNGEENVDLPVKDLPADYLENFYAFHKNKRKKTFDLKNLHESREAIKPIHKHLMISSDKEKLGSFKEEFIEGGKIKEEENKHLDSFESNSQFHLNH